MAYCLVKQQVCLHDMVLSQADNLTFILHLQYTSFYINVKVIFKQDWKNELQFLSKCFIYIINIHTSKKLDTSYKVVQTLKCGSKLNFIRKGFQY
jgi:hypothetical protein